MPSRRPRRVSRGAARGVSEPHRPFRWPIPSSIVTRSRSTARRRLRVATHRLKLVLEAGEDEIAEAASVSVPQAERDPEAAGIELGRPVGDRAAEVRASAPALVPRESLGRRGMLGAGLGWPFASRTAKRGFRHHHNYRPVRSAQRKAPWQQCCVVKHQTTMRGLATRSGNLICEFLLHFSLSLDPWRPRVRSIAPRQAGRARLPYAARIRRRKG
jgi:hypothetical protein